MASRKYENATADEMETFVSYLEYWCNCHPKRCFSRNCEHISQCTSHPACKSLDLNFSENTFIKLSDNLCNKPSAKSIRDYYRNWKQGRTRIKKTKVVQTLFDYLRKFKINPYSGDAELQKFLEDLKEMYRSFRLKDGCDLSSKALKQYPFHLDIIRWWTLFHNRRMKWELVRETLLIKIPDSPSEGVTAECYLGIFEACINEYTRDRHHANAYKEFQMAKAKYLDLVPNKEMNGKYYYFLTRFMEEEWWKLPNHAKQSSTIIFHAILNINKSIELYRNDNSGYSAIDVKPWWLHCHKALLLKLWEHEEFSASLKQYGELILTEIEINPNRKSTQMYAITYFILLNNLKKLNSFLKKLDETLIDGGKNINISCEENKITTVDNLAYHYIELLFYNDTEKQKKYHQVITAWFQRNTH
jgi:hypothetical protein